MSKYNIDTATSDIITEMNDAGMEKIRIVIISRLPSSPIDKGAGSGGHGGGTTAPLLSNWGGCGGCSSTMKKQHHKGLFRISRKGRGGPFREKCRKKRIPPLGVSAKILVPTPPSESLSKMGMPPPQGAGSFSGQQGRIARKGHPGGGDYTKGIFCFVLSLFFVCVKNGLPPSPLGVSVTFWYPSPPSETLLEIN